MRDIRVVFSATIGLGLLACTSAPTPTESSATSSLTQAVEVRAAPEPGLDVHPSERLDPDGRTVTVIGKGFPPNIPVGLAECTDAFPLTCQELVTVTTNGHGMFHTRILVALNWTVINPFPPLPTCAEPTSAGAQCLLAATLNVSPFTSVFAPIRFSP